VFSGSIEAGRKSSVRALTAMPYSPHEWSRCTHSRSVSNLSEALKKLDSAGVRFIAITRRIDTDKANSTSRLMLNILAAVAEFERDMIREGVLSGV
jgi:DNA invertase Pin-like site-specific DNA recombinase